MPLPDDPRTVFLAGLFLLASLAAIYVASAIVLPVVLAIVLKLLLQPVVRLAERLHLPRALGALVALLALVAALVLVGMALTSPAADWASRLPQALPQLEGQLRFLHRPIDALQAVLREVDTIANGRAGGAPAAPTGGLMGSLFAGTSAALAGFFTTLVVLFYLLVFGETFLRRFVEILPRFGDKRRAVEISLQIEHDLSAYMVTVSAINAMVGLATGLVMWLTDVPDPLLWGLAAMLLNYIPIIGPFAGVLLFCAVGVLAKGATWAALLPAGLYFIVHIIEGEFATPMLLAHRFTINPVVVMLGLVFWYWMWGVPGAVLAVPMLAITKIICDGLTPLRALGHFLEG